MKARLKPDGIKANFLKPFETKAKGLTTYRRNYHCAYTPFLRLALILAPTSVILAPRFYAQERPP